MLNINRNLPYTPQPTASPMVPRAGMPQQPNNGAAIQRQNISQPMVERLTVSSLATVYGCCGLFDLCGDDDLLSLSMQGADAFVDWLGWMPTDVCIIEKNFISWVRGNETPTRQGWLSNPCADPNSVEFGTCAFRIEDFARLRRSAPVGDVTKALSGLRLCERQPRYRLDGTQIMDDFEFNARLVAEAMMQDLKTMLITGNATTGGQFDGLENLVKTGYTDFTGRRCGLMDSIVIDWNGNDFNGGAGITWTDGRGTRNVVNTYGFIDVLLNAYREIRQRIHWSPTLASQTLQAGDMVIVTTTQTAQCILDSFVCWRVCPGTQYNETVLNSLEGREFRNSLLSADPRYYAHIYLDGFMVPIITYDWGLKQGPTTSDVYLLTGQIGSVKTMMGEYNNMNRVATHEYFSQRFNSSDGGRFLHFYEQDQTCWQQIMEFQPRLISWTPWANVRFQSVKCTTPGGFLSPDPFETSFFPQPESSFVPAECP